MSEENIDKEIYDAEVAAEAKIAKLESDLAKSREYEAYYKAEWDRAKEGKVVILTPAQCEVKIAKLEEDLAACKNEKGQMYDKTVVWDLNYKLLAKLTLISQMREVLVEAKGCLATLLWDAVKHEALSKSVEKYEGIGKRITDVLVRLSESAAEPAPEGEK